MIKNLLLSFFLLLTVFACDDTQETVNYTTGKGGRIFGGTLRFSKTEYLRTLYPPAIIDPTSAQIASQIYEGLFRFDVNSLVVRPVLVEGYEISGDSTIYTFEIKKGVYFHDDPCFPNDKGRELVASDIAHCLSELCVQSADNQGYNLFKDIIKGANQYYAASANGKIPKFPVEGIKVLDKYQLQITLLKPYPMLITQLARPQTLVYPKEAINKYGTTRIKAVGTGPFVLEEVERDISVFLKRNPKYHRRDQFDNVLPYLDGINIQFIPDKRTELSEFKAGNSQIMYHLPPDQFLEILRVESSSPRPVGWENTTILHKPEMVTHMLAFNMQDKFFKSASLRKAFAMSLDKTTILSTTLSGEGMATATHGITPPLFKNYATQQIVGLKESLDSARMFLEKSPLPNEKPNLAFYQDGSRNTFVAISVAEQIKSALGIEINLEPMPLAKLYDNLLTGKFSVVLLPKVPEYPEPMSFLEGFYGKNSISSNGKTYPNFYHYQNSVFDQWYEKAVTAHSKSESYAALLQAEQLLIRDAAVIPLWYDESYYLLKSNLKNFPINAMGLYDFSEVYFVPEVQPKAKGPANQ